MDADELRSRSVERRHLNPIRAADGPFNFMAQR